MACHWSAYTTQEQARTSILQSCWRTNSLFCCCSLTSIKQTTLRCVLSLCCFLSLTPLCLVQAAARALALQQPACFATSCCGCHCARSLRALGAPHAVRGVVADTVPCK